MNVEEWRAIYPLLSPHTHFLPSSALQAPIAPSLAAPTFPARWPAGLDFEDTFTFYRNQPRYQEHLPPHPDRDYVVDSLLDAKRMVVLAGAGISVDAGIPSFRGPGGLLNQKNEAHSVFDIQSLSDRTKMEGHFRAMGTLAETCMSAQSTLFHVLLAVLGGLGCLKRLYSMNIDGLETRFHALRTCFPIPAKYSELPVTICLHGNLQTAVCGLCKRRKELVPEVYTKLDMTKIQCRECVSDRLHARSRRIQTTSTAGIGVLRPDVVLYNEPVDLEDSNVVNTTKAVQNDLSDWDVFLVVGTSASRQVYSLQARIKQIALSKKPGRSAKVIWLGLENPPQSLLPFLDHILIEDCQIVAKQFFHAGGADRVDTFLSSLRA
ncbi:DHS-like NAD/FAD-binding domain-containing protein [Rhexocercosporidium sp. MPI-PUGE-AT-0058]|nr:DHS-like NAD/FAD-binding domain-containing protein [Rhexocercosporidium sp. MPI-PUGE-AT-0058]